MSTEVEQLLTELGRRIAFPPTPQLALLVGPRLSQPQPRPLVTRWRIALASAVAILAVVFGVPPVRTAIAHWLGIQGVVITPVTSLPATPTSHPKSGLNLGQPTSLPAARLAAGFPVLLPQSLGAPDAVYTRSDVGPVVSLAYAPRAGLPQSGETGLGLLITEFRGSTNPQLIQKFVLPGTSVTPVTVNGGSGFWLDHAPHELAYELPDGSIDADSLRLAGPALVFERGDVTIRIEGNLSEAQALAIAGTLR